MNFVSQLKELPRDHEFFVGIDSDGCVFDTMEIKQKECFCPALIKHFGLQAASKYARQVWEFVNLYSKTRGTNRFIAVQKALQLMQDWHVFADRGMDIKDNQALNKYITEETKLGNPSLQLRLDADPTDKELKQLMDWSNEVNDRIEDMVYGIAPFPGVRESLESLKGRADMIVVSQTPYDALKREWEEHKIENYLHFIAGQEAGTKTEHLEFATKGKYDPEKVIMLGDAPGDYKAAKANGVLYFPIIPGREEQSWARFHQEAIDKFFAGTYAGSYQQELLDEFDKALPEKPHWK